MVPLADTDLLTHRDLYLRAALPGLNLVATQGLEHAVLAMATAVSTQTTEQWAFRAQQSADKELASLPSMKFGVLLPQLMRFLDITREEQLPLVWIDLAKCTKKQELSVFMQQVEAFAYSAHRFNCVPPVILPKLHQDILNLHFVAEFQDDITTGIHPFCCCLRQ
jgi:hypothetical protein